MSRFGVKFAQNSLIEPFYDPNYSQISMKQSHRSRPRTESQAIEDGTSPWDLFYELNHKLRCMKK